MAHEHPEWGCRQKQQFLESTAMKLDTPVLQYIKSNAAWKWTSNGNLWQATRGAQLFCLNKIQGWLSQGWAEVFPAPTPQGPSSGKALWSVRWAQWGGSGWGWMDGRREGGRVKAPRWRPCQQAIRLASTETDPYKGLNLPDPHNIALPPSRAWRFEHYGSCARTLDCIKMKSCRISIFKNKLPPRHSYYTWKPSHV